MSSDRQDQTPKWTDEHLAFATRRQLLAQELQRLVPAKQPKRPEASKTEGTIAGRSDRPDRDK